MFWGILFLLFFLLRLPSLFEPYWYGDEGIYLTIGQAINRGLILYRQIHDNKPPLLYYFAALCPTVFSFRLLLSVLMIPTLYFFYRLSQKLIPIKYLRRSLILFLLLSSLPLLEGNIANAEVFMLLPTIIGVFLAFTAKNFYHHTLSGLLLGIAFTIKIPVLFEFTFLFLWLFLIQKTAHRHLFQFSVAFFLPITLWFLYFFHLGAQKEFLFSALLQNFGYISSWSSGSHSGSVTQGGLLTRGLFLLASYLYFYFLKNRRQINSHQFFLLLWFTSTLFASLLSARPYPHYLIQILPPLCLLIFSSLKKTYKVVLVFFLAFIVFRYKFYFYPVFRYYLNFYSYILNLKPKQSYFSYFSPDIHQTYQISDYIVKNTVSSDRIFVWGDSPFIYALSSRLPAARYTVAYHIIDFKSHTDTLTQIKANLPKIIVYYTMADRPYPELDDFINRYYSLSQKINSVLIFTQRQ